MPQSCKFVSKWILSIQMFSDSADKPSKTRLHNTSQQRRERICNCWHVTVSIFGPVWHEQCCVCVCVCIYALCAYTVCTKVPLSVTAAFVCPRTSSLGSPLWALRPSWQYHQSQHINRTFKYWSSFPNLLTLDHICQANTTPNCNIFPASKIYLIHVTRRGHHPLNHLQQQNSIYHTALLSLLLVGVTQSYSPPLWSSSNSRLTWPNITLSIYITIRITTIITITITLSITITISVTITTTVATLSFSKHWSHLSQYLSPSLPFVTNFGHRDNLQSKQKHWVRRFCPRAVLPFKPKRLHLLAPALEVEWHLLTSRHCCACCVERGGSWTYYPSSVLLTQICISSQNLLPSIRGPGGQ